MRSADFFSPPFATDHASSAAAPARNSTINTISHFAVLPSEVVRSSFDLWLTTKILFFEPFAGLPISPPYRTSPSTNTGMSGGRMLSLRV